MGFEVTGTGDADSTQYEHTVIRYATGQEGAARTVAAYLDSGADLQPVNEVATGDVVLVLGRDFTQVNAAPTTVPSGDSGSATTTTPAPSSTVIGITPPAEAACG